MGSAGGLLIVIVCELSKMGKYRGEWPMTLVQLHRAVISLRAHPRAPKVLARRSPSSVLHPRWGFRTMGSFGLDGQRPMADSRDLSFYRARISEILKSTDLEPR